MLVLLLPHYLYLVASACQPFSPTVRWYFNACSKLCINFIQLSRLTLTQALSCDMNKAGLGPSFISIVNGLPEVPFNFNMLTIGIDATPLALLFVPLTVGMSKH